MLELLKRINFDTIGLDEAVALSAFAKSLRAEFVALGLAVPEYVDTKSRELSRFIEVARQDRIDKRLREARRSLANLETPTEKRARIEQEIAELEGQLNATPAPAGQ